MPPGFNTRSVSRKMSGNSTAEAVVKQPLNLFTVSLPALQQHLWNWQGIRSHTAYIRMLKFRLETIILRLLE